MNKRYIYMVDKWRYERIPFDIVIGWRTKPFNFIILVGSRSVILREKGL